MAIRASSSRPSLPRRDILKAGGAALVAGAAASIGRPAVAQEPITLTVWSWLPRMQTEIDLFEKAHPDIKVNLVNAGQGVPHYVKLRNALKAGTGAPDVAQVEFYMAASLRLIHALEDLSAYGADQHKDEFVPWTWQQVSDKGRVYSMPWDSGPLGLIYRQDILEQYNIAPPATWDAFAEAAVALHKANPDIYLTDATFNNGGWIAGLLWQAGWRPFAVDGTNIRITINDAASKKFAAYWQKLIETGAIETRPGSTTEWYTAYDRGRYAAWVTAAWGPVFLSQFAKSSAGKWRVAPVPQWQAGQKVSANQGGSTLGVIQQSAHKKEAAELAIWLTTNRQSTEMFTTEQFLFPTVTPLLNSPSFANTSFAFYGDQKINQIFIESAKQIDASFQWSPFQDYVNIQMQNEVGTALGGKGSIADAFDRLQDIVVKYATAQGFKVTT
jgi:multiple sugar transport system substrate-binding protein